MANELTFDEIIDVLDIHIDEKRNFLFVTDRNLAEEICEYLEEEFDIVDDDSDLDRENIQEFYVNCWFDEDGIRFYCESANGRGGYKEVETFDNQFIDYFILEGTMSEKEADKYLLGDCTRSWFEIVDEEKSNKDQDEELTDDEEEFISLVGEAFEKIVNSDGCEHCIFDALFELAFAMKDIGYSDSEDDMRKFLDS